MVFCRIGAAGSLEASAFGVVYTQGEKGSFPFRLLLCPGVSKHLPTMQAALLFFCFLPGLQTRNS